MPLNIKVVLWENNPDCENQIEWTNLIHPDIWYIEDIEDVDMLWPLMRKRLKTMINIRKKFKFRRTVKDFKRKALKL